MTNVEAAWKRIRAWYEENVKELPYLDFFDWGPPASRHELASLEEGVECVLPNDVRETYAIYNGDNKQCVLPGGYLMDLSEVSKTWKMFKTPFDEGLFEGSETTPEGPIKPDWWNPRWIPVLHNGGGDYHCIDMDPAPGGSVGQFFKFQHETGPSNVLALSFGEFLEDFANDLEAKKYVFDTEQGTVRKVAK